MAMHMVISKSKNSEQTQVVEKIGAEVGDLGKVLLDAVRYKDQKLGNTVGIFTYLLKTQQNNFPSITKLELNGFSLNLLHISCFYGCSDFVVACSRTHPNLLTSPINQISTTDKKFFKIETDDPYVPMLLHGMISVHCICLNNHVEILKKLRRVSSDDFFSRLCNTKTEDGTLPMHLCGRKDSIECLDFLLEAGIKPVNVEKEKLTCLQLMVVLGAHKCFARLLHHTAEMRQSYFRRSLYIYIFFMDAATATDESLSKILDSYFEFLPRDDLDFILGGSLVAREMEEGDFEFTKNGKDIKSEKCGHICTRMGKPKCLAVLIKHGYDVHLKCSMGLTALEFAESWNNSFKEQNLECRKILREAYNFQKLKAEKAMQELLNSENLNESSVEKKGKKNKPKSLSKKADSISKESVLLPTAAKIFPAIEKVEAGTQTENLLSEIALDDPRSKLVEDRVNFIGNNNPSTIENKDQEFEEPWLDFKIEIVPNALSPKILDEIESLPSESEFKNLNFDPESLIPSESAELGVSLNNLLGQNLSENSASQLDHLLDFHEKCIKQVHEARINLALKQGFAAGEETERRKWSLLAK